MILNTKIIYSFIFLILFSFLSLISKAEKPDIKDKDESLKLVDKQGPENKDAGLFTLKEAIDYAIENNKQIKAIAATLPITEAGLIIAKYRPNPIIATSNEVVKGGSLHPAGAHQYRRCTSGRYAR